MRSSRLRLVALPIAGVLLAACAGSTPTPEPTPPAEARALLRVTMQQALPPPSTFSWLPSVVITLDGRVLTGGAVPAIFPGPLVYPVVERQLTAAGWATLVTAARAFGLLDGARDFTGGAMPPGSVTARLQLVADGRVFDLVGDPTRIMVCVTAPCDPQPGTPEAFGGFLGRLGDLGSWLGADIGPEAMHVPAGYGILVGAPPADEPGLVQPPIDWPLAGGFAAFGKPLADGSGGRCGTVTGQDAAALRPALNAANQLTRWRDHAGGGSFHGLSVRPLLPGDGDPCEGLV
ncbi:MAG TPA: hypothetical protein VMQ65_11825 [Candidatus Limnocylindria bacterium]|nr:hypothetical protein [Candidatus Limnocylindria bacterium]